MKTWKNFALIGLVAIIALFGFIGCEDKDDDPQEHKGTITAFDRTIAVKGDASISSSDFTNAKTKLENAMVALDNATIENVDSRARYNNMLNRTGFVIIIETGNAIPNANANKQMAVGVNYLLNNDGTTIALGIRQKVITDNAFAD